jgi:hypothetical protein
MHNFLLAVAAVVGSVGFALTLGGILSLLLPTPAEFQEFVDRGGEANKKGIAAQFRAIRENRAQMLDSKRLRTQWSDSRGGRKILCCGLALLGVALVIGFVLNFSST